jgi:dephospho-CoA kinase
LLVVGLTGGIGSGKTTLAHILAARGARVIDADAIGREAVRPGRPAWHSVVDQFGEEILVPGTMDVDRALLAEIVFNDRAKLAALNAIVHPVIVKAVADQLERLRGGDDIVVLDAALILETGLGEVADVLVVVTAPEEARTRRLRLQRGMTFGEVQARMAAQNPGRALQQADIVVNNSGSLADLHVEADRVWQQLLERAGR